MAALIFPVSDELLPALVSVNSSSHRSVVEEEKVFLAGKKN